MMLRTKTFRTSNAGFESTMISRSDGAPPTWFFRSRSCVSPPRQKEKEAGAQERRPMRPQSRWRAKRFAPCESPAADTHCARRT